MVLEDICTSLVLWFFALMPCLLTDGVAILPAPSNLSVHSTNMKHLLVWSPVALPGETVYYSVQFQGEYESLYKSHMWIPSSWCSLTERPQCDISDDITATVPYNLRVRAALGSRTSAWSTLKQPFNRNSTVLTPPVVEISKDGFHLVIELEDLGPHFEFLVAYWRREPGAKEHLEVLRSEGVPVHLATMEPGAAYCVKAQTFVKAIQRRSAFSPPECVEARGEALPLALALFAFVGFMLILVVVPLSVWKMGQLLQYSCCPAVVLPDTLLLHMNGHFGAEGSPFLFCDFVLSLLAVTFQRMWVAMGKEAHGDNSSMNHCAYGLELSIDGGVSGLRHLRSQSMQDSEFNGERRWGCGSRVPSETPAASPLPQGAAKRDHELVLPSLHILSEKPKNSGFYEKSPDF